MLSFSLVTKMTTLADVCPHCRQKSAALIVVACSEVRKGDRVLNSKRVARLRCPKCSLNSSALISLSSASREGSSHIDEGCGYELSAVGWKTVALWLEPEFAANVQYLLPSGKSADQQTIETSIVSRLTESAVEFLRRKETQDTIVRFAEATAEVAWNRAMAWVESKSVTQTSPKRPGRSRRRSTPKLPGP